jgi:hypothetical protein
MTTREYKYHRRRRWHRFMCKLSGYVDDYMLAKIKIQQLIRRSSLSDADIRNLAKNAAKAKKNIHKTLTTNED